MLHQTKRLSLQSPLKTLRVLFVHLLLTHSCKGQSQLIGSSQPIVATVGDDIILPCHLEPAMDVAAMALEWTRSDLDPIYVHVCRAGQDLIHANHPFYKGRTSLFTDELKQGNISLKLSKVKLADGGKYKCGIRKLNQQSSIELFVASGSVSSPVISVVLQCKSKGWYPEPEVFWLDSEGNLLSAGPTETVKGPDDLYTVSSRVTVEKRHNNIFTCRVQQNDINQIRETHIIVPASDAVSSPVISLTGLDRDRGGVVLQCESKGWYPEPEVFWLDGEGNLLSAGPAETVRGPVDLYTVSSRVTVEKRHNNNFTCRVQQNNINQIRETHIIVSDDFFKVQSSSSPVTVGLVVCIVLIVAAAVFFFGWKWRQNMIKTKRSHWVETDGGGSNVTEKQRLNEGTDRDTAQSEGDEGAAAQSFISLTLQEEQQRRKEAENKVQTLTEELEMKNQQIEAKQTEIQKLQDENKNLQMDRDTKINQIETPTNNYQESERKLKAQYEKELKKKQDELVKEKLYRENADSEVKKLENQLESRRKEIKVSQDKVNKLQDEKKSLQKNLDTKKNELEEQVRNEKQKRVNAETKVETLKEDLEKTNKELEASEQKVAELQKQNSCTTIQRSVRGDVFVEEVYLNGKYVRLINKSNEEQELNGCELQIRVNDRKPIVYRFDSYKLKAGKTVTIWAQDSIPWHKIATDLKGWNQKSWGPEDRVLVTLFSSSGEEMAMRSHNPQHRQQT